MMEEQEKGLINMESIQEDILNIFFRHGKIFYSDSKNRSFGELVDGKKKRIHDSFVDSFVQFENDLFLLSENKILRYKAGQIHPFYIPEQNGSINLSDKLIENKIAIYLVNPGEYSPHKMILSDTKTLEERAVFYYTNEFDKQYFQILGTKVKIYNKSPIALAEKIDIRDYVHDLTEDVAIYQVLKYEHLIISSLSDEQIVCYDLNTSRVSWKKRLRGVGTMTLRNDMLIIADQQGLTERRIQDGSEIMSKKHNFNPLLNKILEYEHIYLIVEFLSGNIIAFDLALNIIGKFSINNVIPNDFESAFIKDKALYVHSIDQKLYRKELEGLFKGK